VGRSETGLFGGNLSFAPLAEAKMHDDHIHLPYSKDQVKDAPNVDADGLLSQEEEAKLYAHYGLDYSESRSDSGLAEGGGPKRLRYRARTDLGSPTWLPGDRLAVIGDPEAAKAKVVLDPGTPRQRAVDPGVPRVSDLQANAAGELYVRNTRRLALLTPTGKRRGAPIDRRPVGWAPDGRRMLVVDGRELGLLDPDSGRVEPLLHTDGAAFGGASWVEP